jgi:hypothetical protein
MKNNYHTIVFIVVLLIIGSGLVCLTVYLAECRNLSEKIIIALIASLSTIVTITGSIFTNRLLTSEQIRKDKEMEFLKIKREFYHEYLELLLMRIAYMKHDLLWTNEAKENENNILINKMRLPLYASQEVIEFFEVLNQSQSDFSELFTLIRKDMTNSSLKDFKNLEKVTVHLPTIQIDENIQSQIDKMKSEYNEFKKSKLFNDFVEIIQPVYPSSGITQNSKNSILLNKLRMEKLLEYNANTNAFTLSQRGKNYVNLYRLEKMYEQ